MNCRKLTWNNMKQIKNKNIELNLLIDQEQDTIIQYAFKRFQVKYKNCSFQQFLRVLLISACKEII